MDGEKRNYFRHSSFAISGWFKVNQISRVNALTIARSKKTSLRTPGHKLVTINHSPPKSNFPTFAILPLHELLRERLICRAHVRSIPIQPVADPRAQGDASEQNDLGQIGRNVEV